MPQPVGAGALTDSDEAVEFVASTHCDCLAVSIGNVHGRYASPPRLDWDRLERIRGCIDVPLSLHGASGLSDEDVRRASVSVSARSTSIPSSASSMSCLNERLPAAVEGLRLLELNSALVEAVAEVVTAKFEVLA